MKTILSKRTAVAAVAAAQCAAAIAGGPPTPRQEPNSPLLRAGIVSDIHVKGDKNRDLQFFRKALETFRDERVDAVVVPGDLSDDGQDERLEMVAAAWRDMFPGDALPDGSHVEPIFIYGNHDSSSLSYGVALRNIKTAAAR